MKYTTLIIFFTSVLLFGCVEVPHHGNDTQEQGRQFKSNQSKQNIFDELMGGAAQADIVNEDFDIQARFQQNIVKATAEVNEILQKKADDKKRADAEIKKLNKERLAEKFKEEGKIAKRIADLQLGIQQKTLKAQGKEVEAQTLGLQRKLQESLVGALRPGGFKEAVLLFKNFQLDIGALDIDTKEQK